jgi:hypothetical protein
LLRGQVGADVNVKQPIKDELGNATATVQVLVSDIEWRQELVNLGDAKHRVGKINPVLLGRF